MTTPQAGDGIDTMNDEQLRHELSRAAGWVPQADGTWKHSVSGSTTSDVPMPPLDSPIALGLIAGMTPDGWRLTMGDLGPPDDEHAMSINARWAFLAHYPGVSPAEQSFGPTEAVARARVLLRIFACIRQSKSTAPPSR